MKNEAVIAAVIALLKGIEVDGQTMEHIINEVHMTDQMRSQLSPNILPAMVIDQIASDIADRLDSEGTDIIGNYELEMSNNYCEIDSIDLDTHCVKRIVEDILAEHFTPME